jgi:hypothetical protein
MSEPIPILYHGEYLSGNELSRRTGVRHETFRRWRARGIGIEKKLDRLLRDRAEFRALVDIAAANGLTRVQLASRIQHGMDPQRAATLPVQEKFRGKTAMPFRLTLKQRGDKVG